MNDNDWWYDPQYDEFPGYEERQQKPRIWASQNMDVPLMVINYTDRRFEPPGSSHVIFGREEDDLQWVYSDRLWSWDRTKAKKAREIAQSSGTDSRTPRYYQEFLRAFYDKPTLELVCIKGGYNAATLYDFYVYGYRA